MKVYLDLVNQVLEKGQMKENRTGTRALTIAGAMIQHDLREGFPLLTTKKMAVKAMMVELEFFIKGLTDKRWLKDRGCNIWNEWASPDVIPRGLSDEERKKRQLEEHELGPIYGFQWRNFNGSPDGSVPGFDQLAAVVKTLKTDPTNRRMVVSAWNPLALESMALPPCHILFHLVVIGTTLNLTWFQRSCDLMLGIPFNLSSYALLLHLLALEGGFTAGTVSGMLSDVHIYEDHIENARDQVQRQPLELCRVRTEPFVSIFEWEHNHTSFENYSSHPRINFPIAV